MTPTLSCRGLVIPVMTLSEIETLCRDALLNAGASQEQVDIVAAEIADAEAEGNEP